MTAILAILEALAALVPEVEAALPALQALIAGNTVTAAQQVAVWNAVVALEAKVEAKIAAIAPAPPTTP